jgi:hypothetical protein
VSAIADRSPFKAGERVQMHGYPGAIYELQRTGFVGTVEDCLGGRYLRGHTDDDREFCEPWSALVREGKPANDRRTLCCTCCPCQHYHPNFWGPGNPRLPGATSRAPAESTPLPIQRKQAA